MKSKWKCKICQKVLSTKQNVEKHIDKLHPGCDKTKKQYSVEVISNDEIISSNPKKQNKSKSAYSFFSGMNNIFTQKGLVRELTLYPPTGDTSLPDKAMDENTSSAYPDLTMDTHETTEKTPNEDSTKEDESLPETSSNPYESVKSPLLSVNLETSSGILPTVLDTAFEDSPPPTPCAEVTDRASSVINQTEWNPATPAPATDTVRFRPSFKTRGGCGCDKCNRENCGTCYSCLNRSKTK